MAEGNGARNMSARGDGASQHGRHRTGKTAGIPLILNTTGINAHLTQRSEFVSVSDVGDGVGLIQDGGGLVVGGDGGLLVGEDGLSQTTTTLADSALALSDNMDTTVSLQGHTVTNAEWLKAKLGNLGGVFVIQNGAVTADGEDCLTAYDLREVREVGGLSLTTPNVGHIEGLVEVPGASLQQNGSILVAQNTVKPAVTAVRTTGGSAVSLLSTCRLGDNSGKEGEDLSESYRVTLDELDQQAHEMREEGIDGEDLDHDSVNRQEFEAMEFETLSSDKSNMLMTPQELELMPERGKEFEESVGPKEDLRPASPVDNSVNTELLSVSGTTCINQGGSFVLTSASGKPASIISSSLVTAQNAANGVLTVLPGVNTANQAVLNQVQLALPAAEPKLQVGSTEATATAATSGSTPGLATISIATDNSSNSTQILINTPQGQQIFQINTADLNQATSAIQPLCLSGGLVGKDDSGKIVHAGQANGITVEDGYLVIPVNGHDVDMVDGQDLSLTEGEISDDSGAEDETPAVPGRVWMCQQDGCQKTFTKLSKLKIHLMRHTGERPFKCSMADCDWAFTTAYKLKRHEESHAKKKDFECDYPGCGRKFTTIYNLNTHRKLHERPCTEECPECGLCFPTMRKLDLHLKNHIGAVKNYKCPIEGCNKMFFSPHCMGSHTRVHQEDRDLTCHFEGCGKVYDKLCRLKQHMRTHTGEKPYVCNVESCGWAFSTASKLKRHQRKHTGERKWVCPVEGCSKAFMRAEHLKGHLVTHSGERPFICQVEGCGARFTAKSSMYVHIKKHNDADKKAQNDKKVSTDKKGNKVHYFCPLDGCDEKFSNKTGLRTHIAKHYQNALAQANMGDLTSLIPILSPEDIQEGLEGLMAAQTDLTDPSAAADAITASVNSILPPDAVPMDHSDLITADDGTLTAAGSVVPSVNELCVAPLVAGTGPMINQLVVGGGLGTSGDRISLIPTPSTTTTTTVPGTPLTLVVESPDSKLAAPTTPVSESSSSLFSTELDPSSLLQSEKLSSGGSARTDYRSYLMDKAKRRRKTLSTSLETGDLSSSSSSMDLGNFQDLSESSKSSFPASADPFPGGDLVTSTAITFRDPETGAIYVQTQLLQDDPPNPDLYSDDASLDDTPQSVLTNDLPTTLFQDSHVHPDDVEFTGTTINLQDLA